MSNVPVRCRVVALAIAVALLWACGGVTSPAWPDAGGEAGGRPDGGVLETAADGGDGDADAATAGGADGAPHGQPPTGAIDVRQGVLCRDGACPWVAKGMVFVGKVCPPSVCFGAYRAAATSFGIDELRAAAKAFHLDTARFNVSQYGLDPDNVGDGGVFDAGYEAAVVSAIRSARGLGLSVIVTMEWQPPAGQITGVGVPTAQTLRAWQAILPSLADDRGVILEVFNEPDEHLAEGPSSWASWQAEEQALVTGLRGAGAKNVLLVDGLDGAHVLAGEPAIVDPAGALASGVHASPVESSSIDFASIAGWDANFGAYCAEAGHPCLVDDWYTGPADAAGSCFPGSDNPSSPELASQFFQYLTEHKLGLTVFAYDVAGYFVDTLATPTPTSFKDFTTCTGGGGPGAMTAAYFGDDSTTIQ